jgi:hypothetical protein
MAAVAAAAVVTTVRLVAGVGGVGTFCSAGVVPVGAGDSREGEGGDWLMAAGSAPALAVDSGIVVLGNVGSAGR